MPVRSRDDGQSVRDEADSQWRYDAFVSYSREDQQVAVGIQKGLARIGRRMGRLNALRVFRDETDLAASPDLWGNVVAALEASRFLVVILSPAAVRSEWVDREVAHWLDVRGHEQLLLVAVGGQLRWNEQLQAFDPDESDIALPAMLRAGAFPTEPIFVDVTGLAPWSIDDPKFRDLVTSLAAPIHGKSKYDLASDDLREQRRYRRWRRAAVAGLAILTVFAVVAAGLAVAQWREAIRQRDQASAQSRLASAASLEHADPALSMALAMESRSSEPLISAAATAALVDARIALGHATAIPIGGPLTTNARLVWSVDFSPDGRI